MNKRARTLARLKLSRACKDNPDLPRKFVFSLLISEYQASVAIPMGQAWFWSKTWQQGEKEALREYVKKGPGRRYTAKELFSECHPNAATRRTFAATDRGRELTRCKDADELFQKLEI